MRLLHNIGARVNSNYNEREEILSCRDPLSFDGVYRNVLGNADILHGKDVTLFVMGDHVGGSNAFDAGQPLEYLLDWNDIVYLCKHVKAKLGWHTWSHRNLCLLSDDEVKREITPPFPMKYFAYPYGNVDARVAQLVKDAGYDAAWSVCQGDGSQFQLPRRYLNW